MSTSYEWIRSFHIFGVVLWIGSMMSLLFVLDAHARAELSSRAAFHRLERVTAIAMDVGATLALVFGGIMLTKIPGIFKAGYMHAKLAIVIVVLFGLHGFLRVKVRKFRETVVKPLPPMLAGVVAVVALAVVVLVVVQPF